MKTDKPAESNGHGTRRAIVQYLKQEGALDAETLAVHFNITAMAIRQHLYALQKEGLVTYQEEARPMGRPAKLWQLTPAADRFFPNGYAELTLSLIDSVKEAFGNAGLDRLLDVRTCHQIDAYRAMIPHEEPLERKLELLATFRMQEGYIAEIQSLDDDSFLLIENHCPICAAATACTGLCTRELEIFQTILGKGVLVERTEHIVSGERRCVYKILRQS
jgi:predicted ArsR family transcriptional regulator